MQKQQEVPEIVLNFFKQFSIIEDEVFEEALPMVGKMTLKKREHLLREGQICKNLYFLEKGAVKQYYREEDKDITTSITFENDCFTSVYSFLSQKESPESIVAIEDCILYYLSFENCFSLMKKYHSCSIIGGMLGMHYLNRVEEQRINNLRVRNAYDRYKILLENQPQIFQRCQISDIASLLGVTIVTLSRFRGRKD